VFASVTALRDSKLQPRRIRGVGQSTPELYELRLGTSICENAAQWRRYETWHADASATDRRTSEAANVA